VDTLREIKFCIEAGRKFVEKEKRRKFFNKLTFDYSLAKISKEKYRWFYETLRLAYPHCHCAIPAPLYFPSDAAYESSQSLRCLEILFPAYP
jgi:hypothetical protein